MTLSRTTLSALVGISALFLAHCSSSTDNNSQQGGAPGAGGSANGGSSNANGGASMGGSGTGGSATGGSGTGGSANGGASAGGSMSKGGSSNGGSATGGASSNGGSSSGGSSANGGNSSSGGSSAGGTNASGGAAGSSTGGGASKGGSAGQSSMGGQGGGSSGGFTLTSSTLMAGMMFPADATCAHATGNDQSPPFAWTNPPSGTMSYAMTLVDMTRSINHWVIWDIPAATTMLPQGLASGATLTIPAGAKQASGFGGTAMYTGPCPPNNETHTYVFTLYAIDVATLPGLTSTSTFANVLTAIQAHDLASATLSGMSNAKKP